MLARSLIALLALLVLSGCGTATPPFARAPSDAPVATADQSTTEAPEKPRKTTTAEVDEVSTDIDESPVVCRKEIPTGTRLEQTVCRTRTEIAEHW